MKPGRELDALVAEKVFDKSWPKGGQWIRLEYSRIFNEQCSGQKYVHGGEPHMNDRINDFLPAYSTDISAAWKVVEKLTAEGYCPALVNDDFGHWALSFSGTQPVEEKTNGCISTWCDEVDWADTAPHAICLAALKAVED